MVAAIRQTVTIKDDGAIEIRSPELRAGDRAEVIVLVEKPTSAASKLAALDKLQKSLNLTPDKAQKWIEETQAERKAWGNRG